MNKIWNSSKFSKCYFCNGANIYYLFLMIVNKSRPQTHQVCTNICQISTYILWDVRVHKWHHAAWMSQRKLGLVVLQAQTSRSIFFSNEPNGRKLWNSWESSAFLLRSLPHSWTRGCKHWREWKTISPARTSIHHVQWWILMHDSALWIILSDLCAFHYVTSLWPKKVMKGSSYTSCIIVVQVTLLAATFEGYLLKSINMKYWVRAGGIRYKASSHNNSLLPCQWMHHRQKNSSFMTCFTQFYSCKLFHTYSYNLLLTRMSHLLLQIGRKCLLKCSNLF